MWMLSSLHTVVIDHFQDLSLCLPRKKCDMNTTFCHKGHKWRVAVSICVYIYIYIFSSVKGWRVQPKISLPISKYFFVSCLGWGVVWTKGWVILFEMRAKTWRFFTDKLGILGKVSYLKERKRSSSKPLCGGRYYLLADRRITYLSSIGLPTVMI